MDVPAVDANSCPSQTLLGPPDPAWGVDELGRYAEELDAVITTDEQRQTPCYWNLGCALELIRRQFGYKQWGRFLAERRLETTRVSKARAIYRTFAVVEQVAELSVKEAYGRRQRKPRRRRPPRNSTIPDSSTAAAPAPDLVQFCVEICRQAEIIRATTANADHDAAALYLAALDEALLQLNELRTSLHRRVTPR